MRINKAIWLGIFFVTLGLILLIQANIPIRILTYYLPEGNCSFEYPSNWSVKTTREVMKFPPRAFGQRETNDVHVITVDFYDPENTVNTRFVFIPFDEPFDLLNLATSQGYLNEQVQPEYHLWELKELNIEGVSAVRRIESYRIDDDKGSSIRPLVVTYFQGSRGLYSFQLVDPLWPELEQEMKIYEQLLDTFRILD